MPYAKQMARRASSLNTVQISQICKKQEAGWENRLLEKSFTYLMYFSQGLTACLFAYEEACAAEITTVSIDHHIVSTWIQIVCRLERH